MRKVSVWLSAQADCGVLTGYRSEVNSEGEQKITTRSAKPGRRERCAATPPIPKKDQKGGIAGPAPSTVVRIRAREVVCGNAKIVIAKAPVRRLPLKLPVYPRG